MADLEGRLRAAMESAVASEQPPGNLIELVRRRHRRHVARVAVAGAASVAVVAVLIPAGTRVLGQPRPRASRGAAAGRFDRLCRIPGQAHRHDRPDQRGHQPARQADPRRWLDGGHAGRQDPLRLPRRRTIPVSTATNKPGKPIRIMVVISRSTRTARPPTPPAPSRPSLVRVTVTPVNLATNKPGKPFRLCCPPTGDRVHPGREDRLRQLPQHRPEHGDPG